MTADSPEQARPPSRLFVGGLHRSGTSILAALLKSHPQIRGLEIDQMPAELENEGQHVQTCFPVDDALGGPGYFAFNPLSHMTESHPLATPATAAALNAEWSSHWEADGSHTAEAVTSTLATTMLEKSPSNMLRARFLQALYPDAAFIIIVRHPIATAYATAAWAAKHSGHPGGASAAVQPELLRDFVEHWLHAHALLQADLPQLRRVRLVSLEELCASPQQTLEALLDEFGFEKMPLPVDLVDPDRNRPYERAWKKEAVRTRRELAELEPQLRSFGYSCDAFDAWAPSKAYEASSEAPCEAPSEAPCEAPSEAPSQPRLGHFRIRSREDGGVTSEGGSRDGNGDAHCVVAKGESGNGDGNSDGTGVVSQGAVAREDGLSNAAAKGSGSSSPMADENLDEKGGMAAPVAVDMVVLRDMLQKPAVETEPSTKFQKPALETEQKSALETEPPAETPSPQGSAAPSAPPPSEPSPPEERTTEERTSAASLPLSPPSPRRPLIVSLGTRGDVQPLLPLASAMLDDGWAPLVCSLSQHRDLAKEYGVPFVPVLDGVSLPTVEHAEEGHFHGSLARFYEESGDAMLHRIVEIAREHGADCLIVGSLLFCLKFLRKSLALPLIHVRFAPYELADDGHDALADDGGSISEEGGSSALVAAHARDVAHWVSVERAYAFGRVSAEASVADESLLVLLAQMRSELSLAAFPPACESGLRLPGLPVSRTGFWLSSTPKGYSPPPELEAFLQEGEPPVALAFGSMQVYGTEWSHRLLAALRLIGCRVLAIGKYVPQCVREWPNSLWVESVPHGVAFGRCACVLHHGGAGTSAAAAAAGVPAVVVPFLEWSDQPRFASWLESEGVAIHLRSSQRSEANFDSAIRKALGSKPMRENAARVARQIALEPGARGAVEAIKRHWTRRAESSEAQVLRRLSALAALPGGDSPKLRAGLYNMLHEHGASPLHTYKARDAWLKGLSAQLLRRPLSKPDWPPRHRSLDLSLHDLPHASSFIEWWYLHAHLTASDGTPYCVFAAVFELNIDGERLAHVHASLLTGKERHSYYTCGEPGAAAATLRRRHPRADEYFERALHEVFEKHQLPLPDETARERFKMPRHKLDFECDRLRLLKDEEGVYLLSLRPAPPAAAAEPEGGAYARAGFELRFVAAKPPVRNGIDGVVMGASQEDNMFYISITRLAVTGSLQLDATRDAVAVSGSGWYDREFGGDCTRGGGGGAVGLMDVQWSWLGLQLDDGCEVVYARTEQQQRGDKACGEASVLQEKALLIDANGECRQAEARLCVLQSWTSLNSFIKYGTRWRLEVDECGLALELEACSQAQEIISVIATPAYWEGQVAVSGTRHDARVQGLGFVEQYFGGSNQTFRSVLGRVSEVVMRNVEEVCPLDPTHEQMVDLITGDEFAPLVDGLPRDVFVDQMVRPLRAITDRQGKGWRSMGLLLAVQVVGGSPGELERFTSFPEFLHTGSLIIDDIQDHSDLRRGGPSAHLLFGVPTAINAGTAAYFLGEGLTRTHQLSTEQRLRIYELYFTCLRGAHVGQGLDIQGLHHMLPECTASNNFDKMWAAVLCCHRLKSGLPAAICARVGAVLGGASKAQEEALGGFFLALGLAFQIIDDVLNLRGFGSKLKTLAEDLVEAKITAPLVKCLMRSSPGEQQYIREQLQTEAAARDIGSLVALIERSGAFDACTDEANAIVEAAWEELDALIPDSYAKVALRAFGWYVCQVRDY